MEFRGCPLFINNSLADLSGIFLHCNKNRLPFLIVLIPLREASLKIQDSFGIFSAD